MRTLNRMGYRFSQCRDERQVLDLDLTKRLKFAKQSKWLPCNFRQEGVGFYLDGTVFFVFFNNIFTSNAHNNRQIIKNYNN